MGLLDKLKGFAQSTQNAIGDEIGKLRNADALDALVGASVMIAAADGNISGDEKNKLLGFLKNTALTKAYSNDKVISTFNAHADRFSFDADIGRSEALRIIGKQRSNVDVARAIARLCVLIGKADGEFDASERATATQIINELGLNPSEFLG